MFDFSQDCGSRLVLGIGERSVTPHAWLMTLFNAWCSPKNPLRGWTLM